MSTSSGRKGSCNQCGHQMNEHTKEKFSKCKKCGKPFTICQVTVHGSKYSPSYGWKICKVPCFCGKEYYPDQARPATMLELHEYRHGHPYYRPPQDDCDDDGDATQIYADYNADDILGVTPVDDNENYAQPADDINTGLEPYTTLETRVEQVEEIEQPESGKDATKQPEPRHARFPSDSSEDPIAQLHPYTHAPTTGNKGKRAQHSRYDSQDSLDPLSLDASEPIQGIDSMLAQTHLEDAAELSHQCYGKANISFEGRQVETQWKDDRVWFVDYKGEYVKSHIEKWQQEFTADGLPILVFRTNSGLVYWTLNIGQGISSGSKGKEKVKASKGKAAHKKK